MPRHPTRSRAERNGLSLEDRLWNGVEFHDPDECWPWRAYADRGRGRIFVFGKGMVSTPRVVWFVIHGHWPEQANHLSPECDNQGCCNPLHIYAGTQRDNVADMVAAGRNRPPGKGRRNVLA